MLWLPMRPRGLVRGPADGERLVPRPAKCRSRLGPRLPLDALTSRVKKRDARVLV